VLCKVNALPLSPPFWDRLNAMFRFTAASTRPDGSVPQIGDCDDGRLFRYRMIDSVHDHRHLLSVGSVLFQNGLFKSVSGGYSQDALFLLGAEGFEDFMKISEQPQTALSEEFVEGGYVVLRAPHVHITVDVGDIGMRGRGGHGHNDTLSFELWAYGQGFIVDRGTYTYTGDAASRQDFRSTHAHNTIVIDDTEIADFEGLWAVRKDATVPRVLERSFGSERDLLVAEHSGYSGLPDPVTHRRRMEFHKTEHMVKITDELIGQASHDVALRFHIHPDIACVSDSPGVWRLKGRNADILLQTQAPLVQTQSWYSPSYGIRLHMVVLVSEQRLQLPTQITTMIRVIPHTP